jgi:histone H3/H4
MPKAASKTSTPSSPAKAAVEKTKDSVAKPKPAVAKTAATAKKTPASKKAAVAPKSPSDDDVSEAVQAAEKELTTKGKGKEKATVSTEEKENGTAEVVVKEEKKPPPKGPLYGKNIKEPTLRKYLWRVADNNLKMSKKTVKVFQDHITQMAYNLLSQSDKITRGANRKTHTIESMRRAAKEIGSPYCQ